MLSHILLFVTPWTAAHQASLTFTISQSLLKLMSIGAIWPSHPLSFPLLLPSIIPSIRVFSNKELALHIRRPNYWNFSFSTSPSNEYSGLISFRTDWLDHPLFYNNCLQFKTWQQILLSVFWKFRYTVPFFF